MVENTDEVTGGLKILVSPRQASGYYWPNLHALRADAKFAGAETPQAAGN